METIFCKEQILCLRSRLWWVACNRTPFLIRMAIHQNALLLETTNLITVWATRISEKELISQKDKFAKNLSVNHPRQLFQLFEQLLQKPDPQASYLITTKKNRLLEIEVNKTIQVYPFMWKFILYDIECDNIKILCKDLLNPLIRTVTAQQQAYQMLWRKTKIIEQELLKKISQNQKFNYKSPLSQFPNPDIKPGQESFNNFQHILVKVQQGDHEQFQDDLLIDMNFNASTKFIYQNSCVPNSHRKDRRSLSCNRPRVKKSDKKKQNQKQKVATNKSIERIRRTDQQLINELLLQKQVDEHSKKKKKIDFL